MNPHRPHIVTFPPAPSHAHAHPTHPTYNHAHLIRTIKAPHGLPTPPATGESSSSKSEHVRKRRASAGASSTSTSEETTTSDGSGFFAPFAAAGKDASSFYASAAPALLSSRSAEEQQKGSSSSSTTLRDSPTNPFYPSEQQQPEIHHSTSNPSRFAKLHIGQSHQQHPATSGSGTAMLPPPPPRPVPDAAVVPSTRQYASKVEQQQQQERAQERERDREGKEAPYIRRGEMTYVFRGLRVTYADPDSESDSSDEMEMDREDEQREGERRIDWHQQDPDSYPHTSTHAQAQPQQTHPFASTLRGNSKPLHPDANPKFKPKRLFADEIQRLQHDRQQGQQEQQEGETGRKRRRLDDDGDNEQQQRFLRPVTPPRPCHGVHAHAPAKNAAAAATAPNPPARIRGAHRRNVVMIPAQEDYEHQEEERGGDQFRPYSSRGAQEHQRPPVIDPFLATLPPRSHAAANSHGGGSNSARFLAYQEECKRQKLLESCYGPHYPISSFAAAAESSTREEKEGANDVFGPRRLIVTESAPRSVAPYGNAFRAMPPPQPFSRTIYSRNMPEAFGQRPQQVQQDDIGGSGMFMGQASQEEMRHQERLNTVASSTAADAQRERGL